MWGNKLEQFMKDSLEADDFIDPINFNEMRDTCEMTIKMGNL